jgi:hypothetical protein
MNEIHRNPADQDGIRAEANSLFDTWERYLEGYGHRQDYWKKVIEQAGSFADRHGDYGRLLMAGRMEALEAEWRMLHPTPAGNALKEAVDGKV